MYDGIRKDAPNHLSEELLDAIISGKQSDQSIRAARFVRMAQRHPHRCVEDDREKGLSRISNELQHSTVHDQQRDQGVPEVAREVDDAARFCPIAIESGLSAVRRQRPAGVDGSS